MVYVFSYVLEKMVIEVKRWLDILLFINVWLYKEGKCVGDYFSGGFIKNVLNVWVKNVFSLMVFVLDIYEENVWEII